MWNEVVHGKRQWREEAHGINKNTEWKQRQYIFRRGKR